MKVLVADQISEEGLDVLRRKAQVDVKTGLKEDQLIAIVADYDAIMVRSQSKITAKVIAAAKKLQVIARAGAGVDTIDVEAATRAGVIVVNAPTGNTISAAEHTIALMLALSRYIPQANVSTKSGAWKRNDFMGTELRDKTLGVIGLGNIGSEVAKRARGMEMKVLGFDPYISPERAAQLQVTIVPIDQLLKESDYITLHVPMLPTTKGMIGAKELATLKPTARIINCARGGLIDEAALAAAVKEKKIAGAAVDVFSAEPPGTSPLFDVDNIIVTPHLGASTNEAQVVSALMVAEQVLDIFDGKPARYAVNAPFIPAESLSVVAPFMKIAGNLGNLAKQMADGPITNIAIRYEGDAAGYSTDPLKAAVIGGILEGVSEERVNLVNFAIIAQKRGLTVVEQKEAGCKNYASLIEVAVTANGKKTTVAGTVLNGVPHIVRINDYWLDIVPTGAYFLFSEHEDRPGLIGAVGKITGDADINISSMFLGRLAPRGQALMALSLDEPLPEASQKKIAAMPKVQWVKLVHL